jgi:putative polyhydroxyalkanoate system protein
MVPRLRHAMPMSDIDIHHPHSLGKHGCRQAVTAVAQQLATRFGLHGTDWTGDTLDFSGHGVAGSLTVADADAHVRVRLGPWLGLMRPVVEAEIRRQLRTHLG